MRSAVLAAAMLLGAAVAGAQAPAVDVPPNKIGIGTSLSPLTILSDDVSFALVQNVILVPIRRGTTIVEPEFGYASMSIADDKMSAYRLGIGFLMETTGTPQLRPYLGARVGINHVKQESPFLTTDLNGWYIGGVTGAQHYFTANFSLGGEVQLLYSSMKPEGGDALTMLNTQGVVTIRWYP